MTEFTKDERQLIVVAVRLLQGELARTAVQMLAVCVAHEDMRNARSLTAAVEGLAAKTLTWSTEE